MLFEIETYIIFIDCEKYCIDLYCEFSQIDNIYAVTISNPFDSVFIINEESKSESYVEAAKYILDKGRIISILPLIEKHSLNFFRIYIRIEEINRHLSGFRIK